MRRSSGTPSSGNLWFLAFLHNSYVFSAHFVHLEVLAGISPLPSSTSSPSPMNSVKRLLVGGTRELEEAEACALIAMSSLVGVAMMLDVSSTLWVEISAWEERSPLPLAPGQPVHSHIPKQNGELEQAIVDSIYFLFVMPVLGKRRCYSTR